MTSVLLKYSRRNKWRSLLSQPVPLRVAHGWWVRAVTNDTLFLSEQPFPPSQLLATEHCHIPCWEHTFQSCHPCIKCRSRGGVPFSICLNISFYYLYINYHVKVLSWWLDIKHNKLFWEALFSKEDTQQQVRSKGSSLAIGSFLPC